MFASLLASLLIFLLACFFYLGKTKVCLLSADKKQAAETNIVSQSGK